MIYWYFQNIRCLFSGGRGADIPCIFNAWQTVLSELVDGYRAHIDVRQSLHLADKPSEQMIPTWTDLMMWAVLSGQDEMAVMLWAKSKEPLRAALMASQLCRRLHHEPELRADAAYLLEQSEDYEQLALDVLDAIRDSEDAAQILSLIPWQWYDTAASIRNPKWARKYLWTDSPIEMCEEDGKLSYPCRRVVAHRHSQYLCDMYLHGEYPGSSCRISHLDVVVRETKDLHPLIRFDCLCQSLYSLL